MYFILQYFKKMVIVCLMLNIFNYIVNFLRYVLNVQTEIKKYLLKDDIIFIAKMDYDGKLTVIMNLLTKNILFLIWHKYVYSLYVYGMSTKKFQTTDAKYYFMQYLNKNEIQSVIFNDNHHTFVHTHEKQDDVELLYAFLHVRDKTLDILNILRDILKECLLYNITAREVAKCVMSLHGINEYITEESDIKIHLCDMNTLTEQIFKANDCILLKHV